METMRLVQEGGVGAMAAIAVGALATLFGIASLVVLLGKSRAAFGLGVATLALAAVTAGVGMLGTVYGKLQVASALANVSPTDRELIFRVGTREAQTSSLFGFGAALLPLLLGGAAALGGARRRQAPTRVQGFETAASPEQGSGAAIVAFVFLGIAGLAVVGSYVMYKAPLPPLKYPIDEQDHDSWSLAGAIDDVNETKADLRACSRLEGALEPFVGPKGKREALQREPHQALKWREASEACTKAIIAAWEKPQPGLERFEWKKEALLTSPLMTNEALRARVQALVDEEKAAEQVEEPAPEGALARESIKRVVQQHAKQVQYCYEVSLSKTPDLAGKVTVHFTIGRDGSVIEASDASNPPFPDASVTDCIVKRFKTWKFPKPEGGAEVAVSYPFVFKVAE